MRRNKQLTVALAMALLTGSAAASDSITISLREALVPEMIGADVAFFEQVSGVAWKTYDDFKIYKFGECEIIANVAGGSVQSLRIDLSPQCTFDLNPFLPNFSGQFPALHTMTFGQFDTLVGEGARFHADCLAECGNAADPTVFERWSASRADGLLDVRLEAVQASGPALAAANAWQLAMERAEGEQWVIDTKFNCTRDYDSLAHELFADVAISAITVGRDLTAPGCDDPLAAE